MQEPPVFADIESVTTAFFFTDHEIVFTQRDDAKDLLVEVAGPAEDRFGIGRKIMDIGVVDEGDEDGLFVNDDGAAPTETADDGNSLALGGREVDELIGFSRDAEDDGGRCSFIDKADVARVMAQ